MSKRGFQRGDLLEAGKDLPRSISGDALLQSATGSTVVG